MLERKINSLSTWHSREALVQILLGQEDPTLVTPSRTFNLHLQPSSVGHCPHISSLKNWDIFRGTWDLKSATWSLDHKDQHTWIWKWLTSVLGRYKASNISTLWILLLRPIIVTLPFNCSAPRDHNSTRLQTKKDFSHMSVFSKSQLSSPNRLGVMRA